MVSFEDPYYITIFVISLFTIIIDIPVLLLNYCYNSKKTNIFFTVFNICFTSWLRFFTQMLGWNPQKEENDNLFTFCNLLATLMIIGTISQDIWVSILDASFFYQINNPQDNKSEEDKEKNKKKWFRIKILSYFIAIFIPTVISFIFFSSKNLDLETLAVGLNMTILIEKSSTIVSLVSSG